VGKLDLKSNVIIIGEVLFFAFVDSVEANMIKIIETIGRRRSVLVNWGSPLFYYNF